MATAAAEAFKGEGNAAAMLGNYAAAVAHYSAGLLHDPAHVACCNNRADAHLKAGAPQLCLQDADALLRAHAAGLAVPVEQLRKCRFRRGLALKELGQLEEAMDELEELRRTVRTTISVIVLAMY